MTHFDGSLGVKLPEKAYGGSCLLYDPNATDPWHNLWVGRHSHLAYLILKKSGRVKLSRWNRQCVQNQVTWRMSDMAKLSLVAGSWLFHDDDANLWQMRLFSKIGRCVSRFITIVKVVYVCYDNVAMFSPLAPIKIFRLNRPTRRDACAILAHNQVCCRSSPVFPGAPDRQNQVC